MTSQRKKSAPSFSVQFASTGKTNPFPLTAEQKKPWRNGLLAVIALTLAMAALVMTIPKIQDAPVAQATSISHK